SILQGQAQCPDYARTNIALGGPVRTVVTGDFNGDGKIDLVAGLNVSTNNVALMLGNGDGTFAAPVIINATLPFIWTLHVTDLNGDGNGTFATPANYSLQQGNPSSIAAADFNGDGKLDLVMGTLTKAAVMLNNGNGTFAPDEDYATGISPTAIATADFDLDGKIDILTANQSTNSISVLLGKGDGTFNPKIDFTVGSTPWAIAMADFNGNHRIDVVTANYTSNNV